MRYFYEQIIIFNLLFFSTYQTPSFPVNGFFHKDTNHKNKSRFLPHQNRGHPQSSETVTLWYSKHRLPGSWRQSGLSVTLGTPFSVFDLYIQNVTFLLTFPLWINPGKLLHAFEL